MISTMISTDCESFDNFETGCNGNIPCKQYKNFMELICSTKFKNIENVFNILNQEEKEYIIEELFNIPNHDCFGFSLCSISIDFYKMLIENNIAGFSKHYTLSKLFKLYVKNTPEKIIHLKNYIDFFWNEIITTDPKSLLDYRENGYGYSIVHSLLASEYPEIRTEYFKKFLDLWDSYYPEMELPMTSQPNEITDGTTVFLLLSRNLMVKELELVFKRRSYQPNLYEWYIDSGHIHNSISIPFVSYILQENSWIISYEKLEKFAQILKIIIDLGKINFDKQVYENGATLMDYLDQYGYIYHNSPVMKVFQNYNLKPLTKNTVSYKYKNDDTVPFLNIWNKYEYTKDSELSTPILKECIAEEEKTGKSLHDFLELSGIIEIF
jgi:hypothetical protein